MNYALSSKQFLESVQLALSRVECDSPVTFDGKRYGIYLCGNGGSAAICLHIANDAVKHGKRAMALTDPTIMSCLANDEGWDRVYAEQVLVHVRQYDTLVAISSSGKSVNILQAAHAARELGARVVTLSGFAPDNQLRQLGSHNYYVPSFNYGVVECAHLAVLHSLVNPG